MTDGELEQAVARLSHRVDELVAKSHAARANFEAVTADNARLRALVKQVEAVFDGDCNAECPWCRVGASSESGRSGTYRVIHESACPAFTPEGVVK